MPHPEDTLDQLARRARDDDALHAASERRPAAPKIGEATSVSELPESLTQPISEELQLSFVDKIQARLASPEGASAPALPAPRAPLAPRAALTLQRRHALVLCVGLTAAAAGVLLALRGSPDGDGPLSRYEVRIEGSLQSDRGITQTPLLLRLQPGSTLHLELRPITDVRGSVRARAFLQGFAAEASETRELSSTQEQSPAGALRVTVHLPTVLFERGQLLLYVGRAEALADAAPKNEPVNAPVPTGAQAFGWQFERSP